MKCLDMGCGGGHVSLLMASAVRPEGKITGTDTDGEIIALARGDAESANVGNVEFREGDTRGGEWQEEYDLVYARFLFSHLTDPEECESRSKSTKR